MMTDEYEVSYLKGREAYHTGHFEMSYKADWYVIQHNMSKQADIYTRDAHAFHMLNKSERGERGGSVVECRTPEREVRGSRPTAAVLCP